MTWGIQSGKDLFEFASYCVVVLGIPMALLQYWSASRREQKDRQREQEAHEKERTDRQYATYDELDDRYIEYQRCCLQHPELDVWDIKDPQPRQLTVEQKKQELQLFTILFSIFERAYL